MSYYEKARNRAREKELKIGTKAYSILLNWYLRQSIKINSVYQKSLKNRNKNQSHS